MNMLRGYLQPKERLQALSKEEQDSFCQKCWNTYIFPAPLCRNCGLYVPQERQVWCIECEYYTPGILMGFCSKNNIHPASGWSCTEGKIKGTGV